jgi:ADP-heptose:LPS heptosyltransferase
MASRLLPRLYTFGAAALPRRRQRPGAVRRVLIAHHLLLGDTIMLTPLIKKASERFPDAEIVMTCPAAYAPLYAGRPYGVTVLPFDPRSLADHRELRRHRGFDLALVPADNRWSLLARAMDARWIVAFATDEPSAKNWPIDEMRSMPGAPMAWGEIAATLLDGPDPEPYSPEEWPAPPFSSYDRPKKPYCVLHLGASSPHKLWPEDRWREIVDWAEARGYEVVLSAGRGEEALLAPVDPQGTRSSLAGRLDLAQIWDLLKNASFLVCPDTGIAHLARLVGVPTVAIYGPGSPISTGPGLFWRNQPFKALWDPEVPCRDQNHLFERRLIWLRQCWRGVEECGDPVCIRRVTVPQVIGAIDELVVGLKPLGEAR